MDRKAIQEQRKRGYFIDAAKKIIREEGMENLTVKKVADLAGFAPGTLYNYFSDINELLYVCAGDLWKECRDYVLEKAHDIKDIKKRIIGFSIAYSEFFINNPNVFELMFLRNFEELLKTAPAAPEVALLLNKTLYEAAENGLIPAEKINLIDNLIGSSIHGVLLFYLKKRTGANESEILHLIESQVDYVLEISK